MNDSVERYYSASRSPFIAFEAELFTDPALDTTYLLVTQLNLDVEGKAVERRIRLACLPVLVTSQRSIAKKAQEYLNKLTGPASLARYLDDPELSFVHPQIRARIDETRGLEYGIVPVLFEYACNQSRLPVDVAYAEVEDRYAIRPG